LLTTEPLDWLYLNQTSTMEFSVNQADHGGLAIGIILNVDKGRG